MSVIQRRTILLFAIAGKMLLEGAYRDGSINVRHAVTYLLRINLAGPPHPKRVESLVSFVESRGGRLDNAMLIALLSLITAMPEYQLC